MTAEAPGGDTVFSGYCINKGGMPVVLPGDFVNLTKKFAGFGIKERLKPLILFEFL